MARKVHFAARQLRALKSVGRVFYAMKANPNAELLRIIAAAGSILNASRAEKSNMLASVPDLAPRRVLYTPNFAPRDEYAWAFERAVTVTIDNRFVLEHWPRIFKGREVLVRVDTGTGRGHHLHVHTAGEHAKFGVPLEELAELATLAAAVGCRVIGLHAHTGSGVFEIGSWTETAELLLEAAGFFRTCVSSILVVGSAYPSDANKPPSIWRSSMLPWVQCTRARRALEFWLEPGRFLVAAAGVLLVRVTQTKAKGSTRYVGVTTGMNSLIRPALYGSWHEIVNLTRLDESATELVNVVGPICESATCWVTIASSRPPGRRRAADRQCRCIWAGNEFELQFAGAGRGTHVVASSGAVSDERCWVRTRAARQPISSDGGNCSPVIRMPAHRTRRIPVRSA
jgi:diaminopimelate decarboxylase/aspartate kinase